MTQTALSEIICYQYLKRTTKFLVFNLLNCIVVMHPVNGPFIQFGTRLGRKIFDNFDFVLMLLLFKVINLCLKHNDHNDNQLIKAGSLGYCII